MRRLILVLLVIGLTGTGAALAKGISSATVSGPGIDKPVTVGEALSSVGSLTRMRLTESTRVVELLGLVSPAVERVDPPRDLGPEYEIVWHWYVGVDLPMSAFPYSSDGPVVFMRPDTYRLGDGYLNVTGGWLEARSDLAEVLSQIDAGVAENAPTPYRLPSASLLGVFAIALGALIGSGSLRAGERT